MSLRKTVVLLLTVLFYPLLILADENTDKAWQALVNKDYQNAKTFSQQCIDEYKKIALQQQLSLEDLKKKDITQIKRVRGVIPIGEIGDEDTYNPTDKKELNDVATAHFIQAEVLKHQGKTSEAKKKYQEIVDNYPDSYCYDPRGWWWKVSDVAKDRIELMGTKYDYEDYTTETLTVKGWKSLGEKDFKGVELYTNKCIYLYEKKARKMQGNLTSFTRDKKEIPYNWALNDVATCYFILGERYLLEGKDNEAREMYKKATELGFALCWDPKGWYWKVGEVSQDRIDLMGTKYSYGDYRSVTLTNNAWQSLGEQDWKGVELYCKKCIYLYEEKAQEMQSQLTEFAKGSFVPYYWALNDVATCYFILGEAYRLQNKIPEAKQMYQIVLDKYSFAQCWDKRGWYWQITKASQKTLDELK